MALDLPEQLCEYEKCRTLFKPKRRSQRFHGRGSAGTRIIIPGRAKPSALCPGF
jgi:hypothetical protein